MEESNDLLKLLGVDDKCDSIVEQAHRNIIDDLLKTEVTTSFPRPDQIKQTVSEAQAIYAANIGIAFYATRPLQTFINHFGIEKEDFDQICLQGLWSAALTYDRTKGTKFSTWGYIITKQIAARDLNRYYIRPGRIGQTIKLLSDDGSDEVTIYDFEDYRELPIFDKVLANEILSNLKSVNTPRVGNILVERLVWDMTLEECGIKRSITRERIRQLEAVGLQKLKAMYHSGKAKLIH